MLERFRLLVALCCILYLSWTDASLLGVCFAGTVHRDTTIVSPDSNNNNSTEIKSMEKSEIFPEKPGKRSYIEFVCSSSEDKEEDITPPKKIPRRVPVKKLTENIEKLTEEAQKRRRKGNKKFLRMLFNSLDKMLSILEKKVTEGAEERGHKEYMDLSWMLHDSIDKLLNILEKI